MTPFRMCFTLYRPRQSIGLFAGVDLPDYFQGLQIYDGNFVGHADGDVGASAIGGDQNSCCSSP